MVWDCCANTDQSYDFQKSHSIWKRVLGFLDTLFDHFHLWTEKFQNIDDQLMQSNVSVKSDYKNQINWDIEQI